jgi:hypothetical protein
MSARGSQRGPGRHVSGERTGNVRTLARISLLRQLPARRKGAACAGEVDRRERVIATLRQARIAGIRVGYEIEGGESGQPEIRGYTVARPDGRAVTYDGHGHGQGR